jgi:hypothetical protein
MCSDARWIRAGLLALVMAATACASKGTYAVIHVEAGASTPPGITSIELVLTLDGAGTASTTLSEPDGREIALPTDVTLAIQHGAGALSVTAIARDAAGLELDRGTGGGLVVAGESRHVAVRLGGAVVGPDGGASPDGGGPVTRTLTVVKMGSGAGTITSLPSGITCGATCAAELADGMTVTLVPAADKGSGFTGWGGDCSGTDACVVTMSQARTVTATFAKVNYMFVTSTLHTGALSSGSFTGQAAGDDICMKRAQAAGLSGTYKAFLGTLAQTAIQHLGTANGWVRTDGKPFAASRAAIQNGQIWHPPRVDEFGNVLGDDRVGTGNRTDGTTGYNCSDWSSGTSSSYYMTGTTVGGGPCWSSFFSPPCDQPFRIACFGVDHDAPFAVPRPPGARLAFLSSGLFDPKSGLGGADALCSTEATAAGLPGTFKAFLSTNTQAASARFSMTGGNWVRTDGIALAANITDLFSISSGGTKWLTALDVFADGTTHGGVGNSVVTGSGGAMFAGIDAQTCMDWSSNSGTSVVGTACLSSVSYVRLSMGQNPWYESTGGFCSSGQYRVYCLQQ